MVNIENITKTFEQSMDLSTLGFWELIKLDFAIDIEFISRYWMWIVAMVVLYMILLIICD